MNVTPNHYYWPIPDLKSLRAKDWSARSELPGIDLRLDAQIERARADVAEFRDELIFPTGMNGDTARFHLNNGFFEAVDAEVAYCTIRRHKPRRIIEIGSGNSTRLLAAAVRKNREEGVVADFTTIDPRAATRLQSPIDGVTRAVNIRVQDAGLEIFTALEENDICFIDSSHVVALGSDTNFEILEVLPRLNNGVLVHWHDIFLPAEYPKKFVTQNLCFWGEQYLLQAFLSFNDAFEVLWSSSALQFERFSDLRTLFPQWADSYLRLPKGIRPFIATFDERHIWPCSFWIRKRI